MAPAKPARSAQSLSADSNRRKLEFDKFLDSMRAADNAKAGVFFGPAVLTFASSPYYHGVRN